MSDEHIPLAQPAGIVRFVTGHALTRWIERTGCRSKTRALTTLQRLLERADEIELAPKFQTIALLDHDLKPARYLRCDTWVFVVSMDGALLTVHSGESKRFLPPTKKSSPKKNRVRRSR